MRIGRATALGIASWVGALWVGLLGVGDAANAAPKLAVLPFDLSFPKSENDFFYGIRGPSPDEQRRLELSYAELVKRLVEDGRYEIVDLSAMAAELKAAQPFYDCNGCEVDLGAKAKADLVMTSSVDKISETHLSLNIALVDVAKSKLISNSSVLIQGNTDEAWLHGVKWIAKNRLLAEGKKQ
ncbi:MAG: DUF3280 domain-containing protein [Hyphomicrobium sp.]|jgi:hypothetical protein